MLEICTLMTDDGKQYSSDLYIAMVIAFKMIFGIMEEKQCLEVIYAIWLLCHWHVDRYNTYSTVLVNFVHMHMQNYANVPM